MDLFSKLPNELKNHVYEYSPEHREKMYWTLRYISENQFCQVCDKIIIKYTYSHRGLNEDCCSKECLDNYQGCLYYCNRKAWWIRE
jgi:hypothetical protein